MTNNSDKYITERDGRALVRRLERLERKQRSTAAAHADLRHSALDHGARIPVKDEQGNTTAYVGSGPTGIEHVGGPAPSQPEPPHVDVGGEVVKIQHSGLDVHEAPAPGDFRRAQIHVSQAEVFDPSLSTLAGYLEEADGSFTHRLPGGEWYVGVVWETLSGKTSVMSGTVLADIPPLVDTQDLEDTLAEAEQIIADAVAEAQTRIDELRDRLDNFEEYDPSDLIAQINQVNEDLADARQEAAGLVADLGERVDNIKIPDVSGFITQAEVDAAAAAAETAAKEHADLVAQGAKDDAIAEAETKANAAREAAELAAREYADQQDIETLQAAALDAQGRADAAQSAAEAEADRLAKAEAQAAEAEAIRVAAADALAQANAARDTAIATASDDAEAKANAAREAAETYAEAEAQAKADAAQAEAIRQAALDATAKADAVRAVADEAHSRAGTAWDHADAALNRAISAEDNAKTHADNLPKMLGGSTAPTGTAPNGSVWFQRDSNNTVTGRWERINGSWVQQEVSGELIDNLEAGKITALHTEFAESVIGKLWTQLAIVDRLIATTAWIGGAMIGEDAVEAKHIVASETLSGKVAEFLKLNVTDLVATGAQVDDAVIRRLWTDGLVALSATLSNLVVASHNIIPNGDLTQGDRFWQLGNAKIVTDDTPPGHAFAIRREPNDGTLRHTESFPVQGGQEYLFEMWIKADKAGSMFFWDMRDQHGTHVGQTEGGKPSEAVEPPTGHNPAWRPISSYWVPTEWTRIRTILYPGPGVTSLEMSGTYFNHNNGDVRDATVSIGGLRLSNRLDGSMVVENTIRSRHIEFTEELVGNIARLLHLVVDRIDANALWADQTWQAAGYFGSTEGDQTTMIDATGLRITRHGDQDFDDIDIVRLGGEGIGLVFNDEDGEVTGSLSYDGTASFGDTSATSLDINGRPLLNMACLDWQHPSGNQSLLSWRPRAVIARAQRDLPSFTTDYQAWGFLEVAATLEAGRSYWVTVTPFTMRDPGGVANYLHLRYTTDGTPPTNSSGLLASFRQGVGSTSALQHGGQVLVTPDVSAHYRILAVVQHPNGIRNNWSNQAPVQLIVEDAGAAVPDGTVIRETLSSHPSGQPDIIGPIQSRNTITIEWWAQWYQNYSHNGNTRASGSNTAGYMSGALVQGYRRARPNHGIWRSMFGFTGATESTDPAHLGRSFQTALAGVSLNQIQSITLELHGWSSQGLGHRTNYGIMGIPNTSAPARFTGTDPYWWVGTYPINAGQPRRIDLDVQQFGPLLKSGDLNAMGLWTQSTDDLNSGYLRWGGAQSGSRPKIIISHTQEQDGQ